MVDNASYPSPGNLPTLDKNLYNQNIHNTHINLAHPPASITDDLDNANYSYPQHNFGNNNPDGDDAGRAGGTGNEARMAPSPHTPPSPSLAKEVVGCSDGQDDPGGELSEYTDARSSLSAPVELLSEFLSAVMSKDYENALKLCQSILKYEPQNATAREFFPLINFKIKQLSAEDGHSSTDEGNESDEDTMDSYSSLEDEVEDPITGIGSTSPPTCSHAPTRRTEDTVIAISSSPVPTPSSPMPISSVPCSPVPSCSVSSSPIPTMSSSTSQDFSLGIDSGDSLFSSTESDLTLESVVRATQGINFGES